MSLRWNGPRTSRTRPRVGLELVRNVRDPSKCNFTHGEGGTDGNGCLRQETDGSSRQILPQ
jgi:hypothetical protein